MDRKIDFPFVIKKLQSASKVQAIRKQTKTTIIAFVNKEYMPLRVCMTTLIFHILFEDSKRKH
jgi:hypothetical protein